MTLPFALVLNPQTGSVLKMWNQEQLDSYALHYPNHKVFIPSKSEYNGVVK